MSDANGVAEVQAVAVQPSEPEGVDVEVTETAPSSPPPIARVPTKLEDMDILRLENLFLKVDNLRKSRAIAERDLQSCDAQIANIQNVLRSFQADLSKKYGVALDKARINPDGTIIPNAASPQPHPIAAALVGTPRN